jgi:transposase
MNEEIQMKMTRYSEPQILAILRQAEGGVPVAELCREHKAPDHTLGGQGKVDLDPQIFSVEVVCMEARQVSAALSAMRNKTDNTDAKGIAQILRTGWFSPVHMKSREAHGLRALLSTRKVLLKKTMDLANEVRGLLKIFGVRLPRTVKHGSFDGLVRPMIEMDDVLAYAIIPLLDARTVLFQHSLELDQRQKRAASQDEVYMRMMTVPGVGPIAALTFKAAVDDPSRFKRSRTVAAHFDLTPRRFQSGEHDNPGRISKAGDRDVHATLYAAANASLMRTMAGSQIK